METHGAITLTLLGEAEAVFDRAGSAAWVVARETARAIEFDHEGYSERVTGDVVGTIRNMLSAGSLSATVGTRTEFGDRRSTHEECMMVELDNPDVGRVAWHVAPLAETVLVVTFQNEEDATVGTFRRNAFGRVYRNVLFGEEAEDDDSASAGADDDTATDAAGTDGDVTGADR